MAVPRPILLLAVLGALLVGASFYAVRSARDRTDSPQTAQPVPQATTHPKAKAQSPKPARKQNHAPATRAPSKAPAATAPKRTKTVTVTQATQAAQAIAQRRIVVLLFYQPGSADDEATARAVGSIRGGRAKVFVVPIKRLGSFAEIVGGLGISRSPSTVIVDRHQQARVIEGFVDSRTMALEVADSAR